MNEPSISLIGRYRILSELGRGAMGVVYGAEDPLLSRKVAIKTILMSADDEERAEYEPRFYQEAKAAGSLNHPNIITIYDIGREGDMAYMAMELLEGTELKSLLQNGQLPLARALNIAAQVAEGIGFAHERGVIHRDIKPGNVMVLRGDHAKIMDFGIARLRSSDVKTRTGMLLGSPKYMSPEQIVGRTIDHRSDIFSLGVMIYEMVTGGPPFNGPDLPALMHAISQAAPVAPSRVNPGLPQLVDLILAKAMAKKPDDRYQDARDLAADLRACREGLPTTQAAFEKTLLTARPGEALPVWPQDETSYTDPALLATLPLSPAEAQRAQRPQPARPSASGRAESAGPRYTVSPRFDASATLMKLKKPAPPSSGPASIAGAPTQFGQDTTVAGTTRRPRKSAERVFLATAIALALVAAVAIALM